MEDISDKLVLGIKEICHKLSVSRRTLERLRNGTLPTYIKGLVVPFPKPLYVSKHPKWPVDALNAWINPHQKD